MIAILTKIEKKPSKYGGHFFYVFFKSKDEKSYYSCLYPKMRNFKRWKNVMKKGLTFSGLRILKGKLIDADSRFKVIGE